MKKFFFIALGFIVLLVLAIGSVPYIFKDSLLEKTKSLASKYIAAKIDFDQDISLSIFHDFPDISIGLNEFRIYDVKGFNNDTLVYSKSIVFSADILSVIKAENIKINKIELVEPKINLLVNKEGKENWDIALKSEEEVQEPDTAEKEMQISIKKLIIKNANLLYDDEKESNTFFAKGLDYEMDGDFAETIFDLKNVLKINEMTLSYGGVDYIKKAAVEWDAKLGIDLGKDSYTFKDNKLQINDLALSLEGMLQDVLSDTIQMDIKAKLADTTFKNLLSLVPGAYTKDFENVKTDGKTKINFWANGAYDGEELLPKFELEILANNAWVQYPDLPKKIENISFDFLLQNTTGKKVDTNLMLKKIYASVGKDIVKGSLEMKQVLSDNPFLDLAAQFGLDMAEIKNYYPLEGNTLSGKIAGDIKVKGTLSELESQSYEKLQASGVFSAQNVKIKSTAYPLPVFLESIKLSLSPEFATMQEAKGKVGSTDFFASGKLQNVVSYVFGDATLFGKLNLKANRVDVNELYPQLVEEKTEKANGATTVSNPKPSGEAVLEFPDKIDFTFTGTADEVIYDKMTLKDFSSDMHLHDQKLDFKNTRFNLFGGNVLINGVVNATNPKKPSISYNVDLKQMSISNTLKNFEWIQNYVPYTKGLVGDFASNFSFTTNLKEDFSPDLSSLDMGGLIDIGVLDISSLKTIKDIKSKLTNNADTDKTTLENVLLNMKMEKGNLIVKPFNFKIGDMKVNLGGKTSLERKIEYTGDIELPAALVNQGKDKLENLLKGSGVSSASIITDQLVKLKLGIGGDMMNPKLSLGLADLKNSIKDNIKNTLQTTLQDKKQELKTEANDLVKKEADKQKALAQQEIDKQKENLKVEVKKAVGNEASSIIDSLGVNTKENVGNKLKSLLGK